MFRPAPAAVNRPWSIGSPHHSLGEQRHRLGASVLPGDHGLAVDDVDAAGNHDQAANDEIAVRGFGKMK